MRIPMLLRLFVLILALAGMACGGSDDDNNPTGPGPSGNDTHYLRAKIDGVAWSVPASDLEFTVSHGSPGLYAVMGQPTGDYRLEMILANITGVGTYPLGVSALSRGGTVTLSRSPSTWTAPLSGAAGEITFTELSDTLIVGTFQFTARAVPGTAPATKTVTEGEFHLPVTTVGVIGPVPDNAWAEVRATVGGSPWNAAHIATTFVTGTLSIVAFTETRTITITLADVQVPGTYTISGGLPIRSITALGDGVVPVVCCWGPYGAATGSVTITSITAMRIRGTFEASLEPAPSSQAHGTLVIASGTFDNGLPVAP